MKHKNTVPLQKLRYHSVVFWKSKHTKTLPGRTNGGSFFKKKKIPLICLIVLYLKHLDTELLTCSQYLEVGWVGGRVFLKFLMLILVEIPLEKENSSTIR